MISKTCRILRTAWLLPVLIPAVAAASLNLTPIGHVLGSDFESFAIGDNLRDFGWTATFPTGAELPYEVKAPDGTGNSSNRSVTMGYNAGAIRSPVLGNPVYTQASLDAGHKVALTFMFRPTAESPDFWMSPRYVDPDTGTLGDESHWLGMAYTPSGNPTFRYRQRIGNNPAYLTAGGDFDFTELADWNQKWFQLAVIIDPTREHPTVGTRGVLTFHVRNVTDNGDWIQITDFYRSDSYTPGDPDPYEAPMSELPAGLSDPMGTGTRHPLHWNTITIGSARNRQEIDNVFLFTIIPEPGTAGLLVLAGLVLGIRRRAIRR